MLKLIILQLTNNVTMQNTMIKHKISKIVFIIYDNAFLPRLKAKAFP